jgi:hypothetical protein
MIEVKAYGRSARGQALPIEERQAAAIREHTEDYFVYVVDDVLTALSGSGDAAVRVLPGSRLVEMLERTRPSITYWPSLRVSEYDSAERVFLALDAGAADPQAQFEPPR